LNRIRSRSINSRSRERQGSMLAGRKKGHSIRQLQPLASGSVTMMRRM
jgi:hypothetical protein